MLLARGVMYDIRHLRQEEALWLAQSPGDFRRSSWWAGLVAGGVGPWIW